MRKLVLDEAIEAARLYFDNSRINRNSLRKPSKVRSLVRVRWFVMAFMRARDPERYSYPVIARILGFKDHTTVLYGVRKAHEQWGDRLFVKLAAIRPVSAQDEPDPSQAIHTIASPEEILATGEANLARFTNGSGWSNSKQEAA